MKFIANILTDDPFTDNEIYNVVSERASLIDNIPTLIIGSEKTKREYPGSSIIEWKVVDNVYWTYGKYEKRDRYESNLKKFQDLAFKTFIDSLEYVFYDILVTSSDKFTAFLMSIDAQNKKTTYVSRDMMYIYYEGTNKIVGLSLRDCDYIDKTLRKRIFSSVYSSKTTTFLKSNDGMMKMNKYKLRGNEYLLPYIYS